jgi:hypothetical protein
MTPKKKQLLEQQITDLKRKNMELEAQLPFVYPAVDRALALAGRDKMIASGLLIQIHALGGREICRPFMLRDGLSEATIEALRDELKYSHEQTVNAGS